MKIRSTKVDYGSECVKGKNIAEWILLTLCGCKFIMAAVRRTNCMRITARSKLLAETRMWSMGN